MTILIKNGHVLDPGTGLDDICDVLIDGDRITEVEKNIETESDRVIDAGGCWVMPGFIDLHVHFRDPGLEYKETLATGGRAAVRGGVTTVCAMPNTKPVIDNGVKVREVMEGARVSLVDGAVLAAVGAGLFFSLRRDIPRGMTIPSLAYLIVILAMAWTAFATLKPAFLAGAALFIASDYILARGLFRSKGRYGDFVVMLTYLSAQFLLTMGLCGFF